MKKSAGFARPIIAGETSQTIRYSYPIDSNNGFEFQIRPNSAILGVNRNSSYSKIRLPATIQGKRVVLQGIECRDPELMFYNSQKNTMVTDFHPMRGLITNNPFDYALKKLRLALYRVRASGKNCGICRMIYAKRDLDRQL